MVTIRVSKESLKNALANRLDFWEGNIDSRYLSALSSMYSNEIDEGLWDGEYVDIMEIVDNDVINNILFEEVNGKIQIIDAVTGEVRHEEA